MAEPLAYHVTCRLADSRVIAPSIRQRRTLARAVLEMCRGHRILAFNAPDTHLHLAHTECRAVSGRLIRRVLIALRRRLALTVPFDAAEHRRVEDHHHLRLFDYILRQLPHHHVTSDPFHEASNLPDLLGLRLLGEETIACARELLPRTRRSRLIEILGVSELAEASQPVELVADATMSACATNSLKQRDAATRNARRAAALVLRENLPLSRVAEMLHVSRQSLSRLCATPPDPELVRAVKLQLGLRHALARRAGLGVDRG